LNSREERRDGVGMKREEEKSRGSERGETREWGTKAGD
jgi:hypothetical protein